eukprot:COSAG05_NODE_16754_length_339_cov_1.070833_1_plen_82_part_10
MEEPPEEKEKEFVNEDCPVPDTTSPPAPAGTSWAARLGKAAAASPAGRKVTPSQPGPAQSKPTDGVPQPASESSPSPTTQAP